MFDRIRNFFRRNPPTAHVAESIRRWEGAVTDRTNKAHWQRVGVLNLNTINADLWFDLPALRARCTYEAQNNPFVSGVIDTHSTDIVGSEGPLLQVQSDDPKYNQAREEIWREWFIRPDVNGVLSGVEMMRLWVRMLWTCGEYLTQIVTGQSDDDFPVSMRLLDLHPARLMSPPWNAADPLLVLGIQRTQEGKPLRYYIAEPLPFGAYTFSYNKFDPVPPDYIIHQFKVLEPGQARGVPWMAESLQPIADLRDYDTQVMDAARQAAGYSAFMYTEDPDAPFFAVHEETSIERNTLSTLPPKYKLAQLAATQPMTNYVEYRKERQREIGRPVSMPLMMIRSGSEDHNYSAARYDGKRYDASLNMIQSWIARNTLDRLSEEVAREATLARALPKHPKRVRLDWTWQPTPNVDQQKEADAWMQLIQMGVMDLSDVCAAAGTELAVVIAKRMRTNEALRAAGLPPQPYWSPPTQGGSPAANGKPDKKDVDPNGQDPNEPPGKKKKETADV